VPPQRLNPNLFTATYVRTEARTLQKQEFFASCSAVPHWARADEGFSP
jgi:hypothetical protein